MLFSHTIIDICKIVYANIFSPRTKKKIIGGIQLSLTNLLTTIVYPNILYNIGKEYFVYTNNNVLVLTIGIDNLCMEIVDVNDGHVPRKFIPRVTITKTITKTK